jgi:type IV pilus assembly protein PilE
LLGGQIARPQDQENMMKHVALSSKSAGFSLIELSLVAAILAVLAALALSAYQQHVLRAKRVDCQGAILVETGKLERAFSSRKDYTKAYSTDRPTRCPILTGSTDHSEATYTLSFDPFTAKTYTITATPVGRQANEKCGVISINHLGVKTSKGGADTNNDAAVACWR